jgi:hypothetical protein
MIFFQKLREPEGRWPGLPDQVLIDGLADALFSDAKNRGASQIAMVQTLVYELQDRVDQSTRGG